MVLADVSKGNLELARQKAAERNIELSAIIQTDARALGLFAGSQFDAVLLMGPLYHLLQLQERELTLLEAGRRLKQGGFLFASAITRFAPIRHIAENDPEMIIREPEKFSEIVDLGISRAGGAGLKPDYYFSLPEELMRMISAAGFG